MTIAFLAVILLICFRIGIERGPIGEDYLSKERTACINGIFVILIVFSHYTNFSSFSWDPALDNVYLLFKKHIDQLVVATFLFYSGYGMETRIKAKGWGYISGLPEKTIRLLYRFDFAVVCFLVLQLSLGKEYPARQIALSFIGRESIGNSNWYIFVILIEYILMFTAFSFCRMFTKKADSIICVMAFTAVTIAFVYIMMEKDFPAYFYNTVILLPLGCAYALIESRIRGVLNKGKWIYPIALIMAAAGYYYSFCHRRDSIEFYTVWAVTFMALILLVTMRFRIQNNVLAFFGKHVFSIYIIQRIPMIILDYFGIINNHKYIGLLVTMAAAIVLALLFEKATDKSWELVTGGGKNVRQQGINA